MRGTESNGRPKWLWPVTQKSAAVSRLMLDLDPTIVVAAFPFEPLTSQAYSQPLVQLAELFAALREPRPEVTRYAASHCVDLHDDLGIQVVAASGQFPNSGFEGFHGLRPHLHRPRSDVEAQKGEAFHERRDFRLGGTERQAERSQELLDLGLCLFRLAFCPAEHDEVKPHWSGRVRVGARRTLRTPK